MKRWREQSMCLKILMMIHHCISLTAKAFIIQPWSYFRTTVFWNNSLTESFDYLLLFPSSKSSSSVILLFKVWSYSFKIGPSHLKCLTQLRCKSSHTESITTTWTSANFFVALILSCQFHKYEYKFFKTVSVYKLRVAFVVKDTLKKLV